MEDVGSGMMLSHPSRRNEELVKNAELLALQRLDGKSSLFPLSLSHSNSQNFNHHRKIGQSSTNGTIYGSLGMYGTRSRSQTTFFRIRQRRSLERL